MKLISEVDMWGWYVRLIGWYVRLICEVDMSGCSSEGREWLCLLSREAVWPTGDTCSWSPTSADFYTPTWRPLPRDSHSHCSGLFRRNVSVLKCEEAVVILLLLVLLLLSSKLARNSRHYNCAGWTVRGLFPEVARYLCSIMFTPIVGQPSHLFNGHLE